MSDALDRVFGHLVLVVLCEVVFLVLVLQSDGPWYEQRYGVLGALGLGALGIPVTVLVPYLVTQQNGFGAVVLLVVSPLVVLMLRFFGIYLKVDRAGIAVDPEAQPPE